MSINYIKTLDVKWEDLEKRMQAIFEELARDNLHVVATHYRHYETNDGYNIPRVRVIVQYRAK